MTIDIRIRIDLSPRQRRVIRGAVVGGAVLGALGIGVAIAAPKHTFTAGTTISAAQMNENFVDLDGRLASVEATDSGWEIVTFTQQNEASVACPVGKKVLGGGCKTETNVNYLVQSYPSNNGWHCKLNSGSADLAAYAICAVAK